MLVSAICFAFCLQCLIFFYGQSSLYEVCSMVLKGYLKEIFDALNKVPFFKKYINLLLPDTWGKSFPGLPVLNDFGQWVVPHNAGTCFTTLRDRFSFLLFLFSSFPHLFRTTDLSLQFFQVRKDCGLFPLPEVPVWYGRRSIRLGNLDVMSCSLPLDPTKPEAQFSTVLSWWANDSG